MIEHCHGYSTEIEVDVPCSVAYQCYSERETIPQWMPFISSVKVPVKLCSKYISSHFSSLVGGQQTFYHYVAMENEQ